MILKELKKTIDTELHKAIREGKLLDERQFRKHFNLDLTPATFKYKFIQLNHKNYNSCLAIKINGMYYFDKDFYQNVLDTTIKRTRSRNDLALI